MVPGCAPGLGGGILQAATPASPLVLAPLLFFVIAHYGWRAASVGLGLVLLLLAFPLAYCIVRDPLAAAGAVPGAPAAQPRGRCRTCASSCAAGRSATHARARRLRSELFLIPHLAAAATAAGLTPAQGATAVALYGLASTVGALAGGLAADRWGRVPTLMATYVLRGLGALALALPGMPAAWFYPAVALAAGPIFATVTINTVQMFELVGPQRAGLILGVSFVVHQVAARSAPTPVACSSTRLAAIASRSVVLGGVMLLALLPAAGTYPEGTRIARSSPVWRRRG